MKVIRFVFVLNYLIYFILICSCSRRIRPEIAQKSLYQVKEYIYNYHPNPNYFVTHSYTDSVFERLNWRVKKHEKLEKREFQAILETYVASFNDGHTTLRKPLFDEISNLAFGRCFPFDVSVKGTQMYTERAYLNKTVSTYNAEIISINEVPIEVFLKDLKHKVAANNTDLKDAILSSYFPYKLWRYSSIHSPFNIELVTASNDTIRVAKQSVKYSKYTRLSTKVWRSIYEKKFADTTASYVKPVAWETEKRNKGIPKYYLYFTNDIALLRIRSFSGSSEQKQFYDRCFKEISHHRNINTLFIDLRDNRGGRTRNFGTLFSYLSADTILQTKEVLFKVNNETLLAAQKMKDKGDPLLYEKIKDHTPGELISLFEDRDLMIINDTNTYRFKGEIYVLIDAGTFSAAVGFATMVRNNKLGYIIGTPTGGMTNAFGDPIKLKLKGTKLSLMVPTKHILQDDISIKSPLIPDFYMNFNGYEDSEAYSHSKFAEDIIDRIGINR
jgi:C-terminal processing protease CtpA/Prc